MICQFRSVYIQDCYCATYDYVNDYINFGRCMYNCGLKDLNSTDDGYTRLPRNVSELNSIMCGGLLNRDRALCGRCKYGYYPMACSYNISCVECPEGRSRINWFYLTLFVLPPLTIFCFIIMLFRVNATSSFLHGFVLFSQALSIPAISRVIMLACRDKPKFLVIAKLIGSVYSLWSFDILRPFKPNICLHCNTFDILEIDLVIGFYSLFLLLVFTSSFHCTIKTLNL